MADLTGDGRRDLISGSWPGEIYLFEGLGEGRFAERRVLVEKLALPEGDRYARFGYSLLQSAAVGAADWDGDGDTDLVVGTIAGKLYLLANDGARFREPVLLLDGPQASGAAAGFTKAGPCVADWDRDGDLDLVVGTEMGGVWLVRNTGSRSRPVLAKPEKLQPGGREFDKGYRFKPCVTDWNGDGLPDLLIGTCESVQEEGRRRTHGYVWLCLRQEEEG